MTICVVSILIVTQVCISMYSVRTSLTCRHRNGRNQSQCHEQIVRDGRTELRQYVEHCEEHPTTQICTSGRTLLKDGVWRAAFHGPR